jgi:hypothetical protein
VGSNPTLSAITGQHVPALIGIVLALCVCGLATIVGFDRDRAFYPVVTMVIASYYGLFAVMGGCHEKWRHA